MVSVNHKNYFVFCRRQRKAPASTPNTPNAEPAAQENEGYESLDLHHYAALSNTNQVDGNSSGDYDDIMSSTPPVYDLPYADAPSADPGGFVALGRGSVTQYTTDEDGHEVYMEHGLPGAIGNPSVVTYE